MCIAAGLLTVASGTRACSTGRHDVCDRRLRRRAQLIVRRGGWRALRQPLGRGLVGVGGPFITRCHSLRFAPPAEQARQLSLPLLIVLFSALLSGERCGHHIISAAWPRRHDVLFAATLVRFAADLLAGA